MFIFFYIIALIPVVIGLILFWYNKSVTWQELVGGSVAAFILSVILNIIAVSNVLGDTETWSGHVTRAVYYPKWIEEYTQIHTSTDSKGNVRTWTTTEHRTHWPHWRAETDIHDSDIDISKSTWEQMVTAFGGLVVTTKPWKSGFDSGDPRVYTANYRGQNMYPVTDTKTWENRVKASKTLFSFIEVPKDVKVYPYPQNNNVFSSDRLVGTASKEFNLLAFDRMNARLGARKKVNIIFVGFNSSDKQMALYQEAAWKGGKKNDVVLCYGRQYKNQEPWVHVFSWSERTDMKQELADAFKRSWHAHGIVGGMPTDKKPVYNNTGELPWSPSSNTLAIVEDVVRRKYFIKDWHKFDYIKVEPPTWSYVVLIIFMALTQFGLWWWFHNNEFGKDDNGGFANRIFRITHRGWR